MSAFQLYRMLKQLVDDGWIAEVDRADESDPRRRYYRLTPRGRRAAQTKASRHLRSRVPSGLCATWNGDNTAIVVAAKPR
ncbi:MAG TPA: helix-turn-helix transcriptional regulator [Candidatus Baltobacteraceae bacterium]|nr:helix-turn-helix transcriptional regulator [Candidatus Baltobacteraceae bacterium]